MGERARISVARFAEGVTVRVDGPGTMSESPVVHAFAEKVLDQPSQRVVVDLSACTYLDSTFLGGLVSLYKRHVAGAAQEESKDRSEEAPVRFAIHAPAEKRRLLFSVSRLDQLLPFVEQLPAGSPTGPEGDLALDVEPHASREELARYVVECHRRLAELGGAEARDFGQVADALEKELRTPPSTGRS
jgi:anti-sigma B factor antagonist